jgi:hypothetical protein
MVSERAKAKQPAAQLHMGVHWTFYPASRCSGSGDLEGLWCVRKGDEARIGSDRFAWELDAGSWLAALSFWGASAYLFSVLTGRCPAIRGKWTAHLKLLFMAIMLRRDYPDLSRNTTFSQFQLPFFPPFQHESQLHCREAKTMAWRPAVD